jgi:hypothetical protein
MIELDFKASDGRSVAWHLSECRRRVQEAKERNATIQDLKKARLEAFKQLGINANKNMCVANHSEAVAQALAAKQWNQQVN